MADLTDWHILAGTVSKMAWVNVKHWTWSTQLLLPGQCWTPLDKKTHQLQHPCYQPDKSVLIAMECVSHGLIPYSSSLHNPSECFLECTVSTLITIQAQYCRSHWLTSSSWHGNTIGFSERQTLNLVNLIVATRTVLNPTRHKNSSTTTSMLPAGLTCTDSYGVSVTDSFLTHPVFIIHLNVS